MIKHIHKYFRDNIGIRKPYIVYRCAVPECYHYIPENQIIGRESVCWRCGGRFVISQKLIKQTCSNCLPVRGNPAFSREKIFNASEVDLNKLRELIEEGEDDGTN